MYCCRVVTVWLPSAARYDRQFSLDHARPGQAVICNFWHPGIQGWALECSDVKNYKWRLNPVWCYCCCETTVCCRRLLITSSPSWLFRTPVYTSVTWTLVIRILTRHGQIMTRYSELPVYWTKSHSLGQQFLTARSQDVQVDMTRCAFRTKWAIGDFSYTLLNNTVIIHISGMYWW